MNTPPRCDKSIVFGRWRTTFRSASINRKKIPLYRLVFVIQVIITGRAGGLHQPPWGIPHAEPIGSSKNPPLAEVAPQPQTWQLSLSLPCVKGGGTACRDGGIVLA